MRLAAEEERGVGPLGRLASSLFLPSNALTVSNISIIALGMMPTLRFTLKAVAVQQRREKWSSSNYNVCVIYREG